MLLVLQDLLMLRDDIILLISSLFVAVFMEESFYFIDKKLLNDLLENLSFGLTVSESIYDFDWSLMCFSSLLIMDGVSLVLLLH